MKNSNERTAEAIGPTRVKETTRRILTPTTLNTMKNQERPVARKEATNANEDKEVEMVRPTTQSRATRTSWKHTSRGAAAAGGKCDQRGPDHVLEVICVGLLPPACCLLPAACCLLSAACCLLPAACCLQAPLGCMPAHLPAACLLPSVCLPAGASTAAAAAATEAAATSAAAATAATEKAEKQLQQQ